MTFVFLASFIGGMLLAVRTMIFGVERLPEHDHAGTPSFRITPPLIVAFTAVFGVVGYFVTTRSSLAPVATTGIAAAGGLVASLLAAWLVRRLWAVEVEHEEDERYLLQGHLAQVVTSIDPTADGEVAFEVGAQRRVLRARGIDPVPMSAGTEVVIERIEDDVAYVESWGEVEKRL